MDDSQLLGGKVGKFLRLFFGCHALPERSFFCKGKQFPICSRCTGMLAGFFAGIPFVILTGIPGLGVSFLLCVPLIIDGSLQRLSRYRSNNVKRVITGFICGIALFCFLGNYHMFIAGLARGFLDWRGVPHR